MYGTRASNSINNIKGNSIRDCSKNIYSYLSSVGKITVISFIIHVVHSFYNYGVLYFLFTYMIFHSQLYLFFVIVLGSVGLSIMIMSSVKYLLILMGFNGHPAIYYSITFYYSCWYFFIIMMRYSLYLGSIINGSNNIILT